MNLYLVLSHFIRCKAEAYNLVGMLWIYFVLYSIYYLCYNIIIQNLVVIFTVFDPFDLGLNDNI